MLPRPYLHLVALCGVFSIISCCIQADLHITHDPLVFQSGRPDTHVSIKRKWKSDQNTNQILVTEVSRARVLIY